MKFKSTVIRQLHDTWHRLCLLGIFRYRNRSLSITHLSWALRSLGWNRGGISFYGSGSGNGHELSHAPIGATAIWSVHFSKLGGRDRAWAFMCITSVDEAFPTWDMLGHRYPGCLLRVTRHIACFTASFKPARAIKSCRTMSKSWEISLLSCILISYQKWFL